MVPVQPFEGGPFTPTMAVGRKGVVTYAFTGPVRGFA